MEFKTDLLVSILASNTLTVKEIKDTIATLSFPEFTKIVKELVPTVSFGRQAGHDTAIKLFVENHPDLNIALSLNKHDCNNSYGNARAINGDIRESLKGADYIILNSTLRAKNEKILLELLMTPTNSYDNVSVIIFGAG